MAAVRNGARCAAAPRRLRHLVRELFGGVGGRQAKGKPQLMSAGFTERAESTDGLQSHPTIQKDKAKSPYNLQLHRQNRLYKLQPRVHTHTHTHFAQVACCTVILNNLIDVTENECYASGAAPWAAPPPVSQQNGAPCTC